MRPAILPLVLLLSACTQEPAAPAPAPEPAPEPPAAMEPAPEEDVPSFERCESITFTEGAQGEYAITEGGDDHVKHHFEMPEGIDTLVVDVTWPDAEWSFEIAAGVGHCPHHGTTHMTVQGGPGHGHILLPVAKVSEELETFTAGETWYVHLASKGEREVGAKATFAMDGKACVSFPDEAARLEVKADAPAAKIAPAPPTIKKGAPGAVKGAPKIHEVRQAKQAEKAAGEGEKAE